MKSLPILLLDMDGIIADFNLYSIQTYNRLFNGGLDETDVNRYIGDHEVIDPTVDVAKLRQPYKEPGFFINLPVFDGSQAGVELLSKYFQIYVLTTQYYNNPTCVYEKHLWLERHFPSISDQGIYTKHKHRVMGDVLVDDKPSNLSSWTKTNPFGLTASLSYPWSNPKVTTVLRPTWKELSVAIIEEYFDEQKR